MFIFFRLVWNISKQGTALGNLVATVLMMLKLTGMDELKPPEYWKSVICIMMIRSRHQNATTMIAAQCALDTVKIMRCEMESCNGLVGK